MSDEKLSEFIRQNNHLYRLMQDAQGIRRNRITIAFTFDPSVTPAERDDVIESVREALDYRIFRT